MSTTRRGSRLHPRRFGLLLLAAFGLTAVCCGLASPAQAARRNFRHHRLELIPGNLLISRSVYTPANIQSGVTVLPPGCVSGCAVASTDGTYPFVFNNDLVDASFGVTSRIFLDQVTPWGERLGSIAVPENRLVTSFSSKSELALNVSTSGRDVTFMGYVAPVAGLDVSNSNTPGVSDPTNPVPGADYRAVAELDGHGRFHFTETNAYSGNNGRAAILNDERGANVFYTAGNAGNGSNPQPNGIILGAGAQILTPVFTPEADQSPGTPTPVASFNVTQLGDKSDKIGKDDNFRGLTIANHVLYYTKGSGSNGVNTVYFVDTTGSACPNGTGLPAPNAALPSSPLTYDPAQLQANGLPSNVCILGGFPTTLAKSSSSTAFPFGLWFANAHTLYVADEGNGTNSYSAATGQYSAAAAQTTAGLQKWVFDSGSQSWKLAYTLASGLKLGEPIWAVTSTVSGGGDQGADPNKVVAITDALGASTPGSESFRTIRAADAGEVLRGVSLTPER